MLKSATIGMNCRATILFHVAVEEARVNVHICINLFDVADGIDNTILAFVKVTFLISGYETEY